MAHGLEVRVPFLDPVVAELAYALPLSARVRGFETKRGAARRRRAAAAAGDRARPQARLLHAGRGLAARAAGGARARPAVARAGRAPGLVRPGAGARACSTATSPRREDLGRPLWALIAFGLWHDAWAAAPPPRLEAPATILQAAA